MPAISGGDALALSLKSHDVNTIFGLPGVQIYGAMEGLYNQSEIEFITTRHEQAATYMADGFSRSSGQVGVSLVVPGPGIQNASAGIGTAYAASSKVLSISGQIPRDMIGVDRGLLHEINDQLDLIKPITKWSKRVLYASEIPEAVTDAFYHLNTGRPRPVHIEIPPEALTESTDFSLPEKGNYTQTPPSKQSLKNAVSLIHSAKNPLIIAGGGCISSNAGEQLMRFAELLQSPIITTPEGKGSIDERHPLSIGSLRTRNDPYNSLISNHDLIIAIGTRLSFPEILSDQDVLQIDIDPEEIGRNYKNTQGVIGDASLSLFEINNEIEHKLSSNQDRYSEIVKLRDYRLSDDMRVSPHDEYVKAIRSALPENGIFVSGMTQVGYYSRGFFPTYYPRTFFTSSYFGNLGYAFPFALGAKVANPDKPVLAITGDGGFMFNVQELSTAVRYGINTITILFNDNAFGNVKRDQETLYNGHTIGSDLLNPDFMKLSESFGVIGIQATSPKDLKNAIISSLDSKKPVLIEVPYGPTPYPF